MGNSVRKVKDYTLKHLPSHLMANRDRCDNLVHILTDIAFLEEKTRRGMLYGLLEDFTKAVSYLPKEHTSYDTIRLLEEAIRRDIQFIERHPTTLFQCLWNSCWWYDCPQAEKYYEVQEGCVPGWNRARKRNTPKLHELLEKWRKQKEEALGDFNWMRSLRPPAIRLGGCAVTKLEGHSEPITALAISPNGQRVVSASYDEARIWEVKNGREVGRVAVGDNSYLGVGFLDDDTPLIVRVVNESLIALHNGESNEELWRLKARVTGLSPAVLSGDGKLLAVVLKNGSVVIWDWQEGKKLACLSAPSDTWSAGVVISGDNTSAIVEYGDGTIAVWAIESATRVVGIPKQWGISGLDISYDGQKLLWADTSEIVLFDVKCKKPILRLEVEGLLNCVALSFDAKMIVSGLLDGAVYIWDVERGTCRQHLRLHRGLVSKVALSRDRRFCVSGAYDNTVRVCRLGGATVPFVEKGHTERISAWEMPPDGKWVATGSLDSTIRIWSTEDGTTLFCLKGHWGKIRDIWASSGEKLLFSHAEDEAMRIWDVESGKLKGMIRTTEGVGSMCVSRDCRYIAAAVGERNIKVWNVTDQSQRACLERPRSTITSLDFSPDGNLIASGAIGDGVQIWDVKTKRSVGFIHGRKKAVFPYPIVRFFPDGRRIAFTRGCADTRIWDIEKKEELACLQGHEDPIQSIAVSEDGSYVVTMSEKYRVIAWNAHTFEVVEDFAGYLAAIGDLRAVTDPDGRFEWRAIPSTLGSTIRSLSTGQDIAWCPTSPLSVLPCGDKWVSVVGSEFHLYAMEGRRHGEACVRRRPLEVAVVYEAGGLIPPAKLVMRSSPPRNWSWQRLLSLADPIHNFLGRLTGGAIL